MSDVLLINPKSFQTRPSYLPYGILYIAGLLKARGIDVAIYDANVEELAFEKALKYRMPKIVGFSVLSGPCISDAVKKSQIVRRLLHDTKIVWGGIHTTIFPKLVLKQDYVDYVIVNEGEYPFYELTEKILNNDKNITEIRNLGYISENQFHFNKIRPFIDLEEIPLPAWDLLPIEKYVHRKFYSDKVLTLHTSRGCPWSCSFCYNELVNFRKWRGISHIKIIEQIRHVMERYGIKGIQFYDDEFDANTNRASMFYELLMKENIKISFGHYSRTNLADEDRYRLAKAAGCCFIEFGVESGSETILNLLRKQQTVNGIKRAFDMCHTIGLKTGAMFMVGIPYETKEDVDKTIGLVKSLGAHQAICTIFRPYPGSRLFEYCINNELFTLPENLDEQGHVYDIGNANINVSNINTAYLKKAQNIFLIRNIVNELKVCIRNMNIGFILYFIRKLDIGTLLFLGKKLLRL